MILATNPESGLLYSLDPGVERNMPMENKHVNIIGFAVEIKLRKNDQNLGLRDSRWWTTAWVGRRTTGRSGGARELSTNPQSPY